MDGSEVKKCWRKWWKRFLYDLLIFWKCVEDGNLVDGENLDGDEILIFYDFFYNDFDDD